MALTVSQINKKLKEKIDSLYLFYGEERFILSSYIERIKNKVVDNSFSEFNYSVFEGKGASLDEFLSELATYPQMSDKKLLVLKNTDFLILAEYQKDMLRHLSDIPDYAVVIFVEDDIKKVKKDLLKIIEAKGVAVEFSKQSIADLRSWVNRAFSASGKTMKTEDIEHLINICDRSLDRLKTECDKLIAAVGSDEVITRAYINDMVQIPLEYKIYTMADKLLSGDAAAAYTMLRELKLAKEQPTVVISLIYSQLSALYMFCRLNRGAEAFLPPNRKFLAKKYLSECRRYDEAKLRRIMRKCADFDNDIKNGKTDGWTALELVMAMLL